MTAMEKLAHYKQDQVLMFSDELEEKECIALENQIEALDFGVLDILKDRESVTKRGVISPLKAMELSEIESRKAEFEAKGLELIRQGKVGAVLLAGGMGTRLGSDDPKGMFCIGETRDLYIFECLIHNLMDVVKVAGNYIHLFVMTSDLNHEKTVRFFNDKNFFGYPKEYVTFFQQEMAPACDRNGKLLMEAKNKIAVSPNGNGGWFLSMQRSGALSVAKEAGIEWLNLFAVDNVLQRICDPVFIGATAVEGKTVGSKVVRKVSPDERVGVMCLEDGKPSIVEYYELTEQMRNETDERGERVYNFGVILNYLFRVDELEEIVNTSLPYHVVEKKVNYLNEDGELVKPETPNAYKFEQLVLDMIHLADSCLPFEVVREREFAPVKNKEGVDSVDTARELLKKNGVKI